MAKKIGVTTYYSTSEVAEKINVTQETVASWCRKVSEENRNGWRGLEEGRNFRQINKRWYLTEKWLENYLQGRFSS